MKKSIFLFLGTIVCTHLFSQTYQDYLSSGLDAYARSDWSSAVFSFQKAAAAAVLAAVFLLYGFSAFVLPQSKNKTE